MPDNKEWISSKEGAELLGIPQPNYLYYARNGTVRTRPGKRWKEYNLADTIELRKQLERPRRPIDPILIDWLKGSDIPAALRLDQTVYNEVYLAEANVYQEWRKKNPYISIAAFDSRDRNICLAYASLVPVSWHVAEAVLSGKRTDNSIQIDEIETYERPGPYNLLAISAVTHPDRPDLLFQILYGHMHYWLEMYPARFIQKIYAQSVSERGEMLIQHLFMAPRPDLAFNAYELDLSRPSASRIIRQFKKHLEEKAPLPLELQWKEPDRAENAPTGPTMPIARNRLPSISARPGNVLELPDNLIALKTYANQKGIAPSTLVNAVNSGKVPIIEGTWKQGRSTIKKALDADGRRIVDELYGK